MMRWNILLLLVLTASALVLVKTAYDARRLFSEIHRAETEALRLEGEHRRLEADRQLQATNMRVERTARERLKMSVASPAVTIYEGQQGSPASAALGRTGVGW